ncbi:MAG: A/G-specific adenine glycosylase [Anaerolineales bacterium]|nr:A/G-specific adenine glycosylase [Anaerolineales bacterium]
MRRFPSKLLNWYAENKRTLPWRGHRSPYAVWVSEIMLQQTRVETVIPYFKKWMKTFPTVYTLARASEQDVLNAWEGLGYYSRARNFHKAAKIVVEDHEGKLPRNMTELQKLPGIGRYTAGALASIVFGMDEPALDGNLKRVYARLFDVEAPINSTEGERLLWEIAYENLPTGKAADFNQALMDLGATICLPKNPRCEVCPLAKECKAKARNVQGLRPVKTMKRALPRYTYTAAAIIKRINNSPCALLVQRPSKGLLGGMWEFPNARVADDPAEALAPALKTAYRLTVRKKRGVQNPLVIVEHAYSHFSVVVHAFLCESALEKTNAALKWIRLKDLEKYPMGKIDRTIARKIITDSRF